MSISVKTSSYQFYLLIILILIAGCNSVSQNPDHKRALAQLIVDTSENNTWGGDVELKIVDKETHSNGKTYIVKALYDRDTVGLAITVPNNATSSNGFSDGLKITTLGKISDNFLHALTAIYKLNVDSSTLFVKELSVSYVNLGQLATSMGNELTDNDGFAKHKLFFQISKNGKFDEAEVYLNINEDKKVVQLMEKDEEYRTPLISALTK